MRANATEAAEQCGILQLPEIRHVEKLDNLISGWNADRHLIFCDEATKPESPVSTLEQITASKFAILIGPEGGFSDSERELLASQSFVTKISLGPRVLRADTAAVAALAVLQATVGDWIDQGS